MTKIIKTAIISNCERYRYTLTRIWDDSLGKVLFIGLNPSTADADKDDSTIRKLTNYCKSWGYGGFTIVNLFALRSRHPYVLFEHSRREAQGPDNLKHIIEQSSHFLSPALIVCMWGNMGGTYHQNRIVLDRLKGLNLHCFDISKTGMPKHPLYLKGDLQPKIFISNVK